MKICEENIFLVNFKNDSCWCELWCDVKQQEIKELAG